MPMRARSWRERAGWAGRAAALYLAVLAAGACGARGDGAAPTAGASAPPLAAGSAATTTSSTTTTTGSGAAAVAGGPAAVDAAGSGAAGSGATAATVPAAPAPVAKGGADFLAAAQLLVRVAACGSAEPVAPPLDAAVVAAHCARLDKRKAGYRAAYFEGARAFFDELVPDDVPATVVYPFGGGDLISALVAFPEAREITTISLELSGDPRRLAGLDKRRLKGSLSALSVEIGGLLSVGSNTSANLSASQRNDLPAQTSSFLIALVTGGYEVVGLRYFRLGDDGAVTYLSEADIAGIEASEAETGRRGGGAKSRKNTWKSPNFSDAFANVEIEYRRPGEAGVRVHRHLAWNLGDEALRAKPQLLRHLEAKGKVTLLTKGASYLLWNSGFSLIRQYMLDHLAWMLSDSTGIPPAYARKAGMEQVPYGRFDGAFLEGAEAYGKRHSDDFRALWRSSPRRRLPFRFGYVDAAKQAHLVVTRPALRGVDLDVDRELGSTGGSSPPAPDLKGR